VVLADIQYSVDLFKDAPGLVQGSGGLRGAHRGYGLRQLSAVDQQCVDLDCAGLP